MDADIASLICSQFLSLGVPAVDFNWHGGEPTLCGVDVLRTAIQTQERLNCNGRIRISNKLQTNGVNVSDDWLQLLKQYPIDVGVSLDGPAEIHDLHRTMCDGRATFANTIHTIERLQTARVPFGVLMVVTEDLARNPDAAYEFISSRNLAVDLLPCYCCDARGHSVPPTVSPRTLASFLTRFFDRWVQDRCQPLTCRLLEDFVAGGLGLKPQCCSFRNRCEQFYSVDTEGRIYPCDLFLGEDGMMLGDLRKEPLSAILRSERADQVRRYMKSLVSHCQGCGWFDRCGGGCKSHREMASREFRGGYYFCATRIALFRHVDDFLRDHKLLRDEALLFLENVP
jgi:uncharacterized protein